MACLLGYVCLEGFEGREVMLGWFGWRDDGVLMCRIWLS